MCAAQTNYLCLILLKSVKRVHQGQQRVCWTMKPPLDKMTNYIAFKLLWFPIFSPAIIISQQKIIKIVAPGDMSKHRFSMCKNMNVIRKIWELSISKIEVRMLHGHAFRVSYSRPRARAAPGEVGAAVMPHGRRRPSRFLQWSCRKATMYHLSMQCKLLPFLQQSQLCTTYHTMYFYAATLIIATR